MWQDKEGFTLLELLIVMMIIAITAGVVTPVVYKSVDKFNQLLIEKERVDLQKEADYLSFIKDETCKVKNQVVICDQTTYVSLKDVFK